VDYFHFSTVHHRQSKSQLKLYSLVNVCETKR
jgi:hypothetical protein